MIITTIKDKYNSLSSQLRTSIWFLLCYGLQKGISIVTVPIFTRLLSTEEFGEYNVFTSWMSVIAVFVTLNIYYGVFIQGLVKFEEEKGKYTASMQGLVFTLTMVWTVIYLIFQDFWCGLFSLSNIQMICMLILIWANAIFILWTGEERERLNYKKYAFVTLVFVISEPVLGVLFVLNAQDKVTAKILSMVIVNLVIFGVLSFFKILKEKTFFSWRFWSYALKFNIVLLPHYLSTVIINSADRLMIDHMVGESAAGIYSLAYTLAMIMLIVNQSVLQVVEPWIYKKIKAGQYSSIADTAYPLFMAVAVLNILLIAVAPEGILVLAPPEYYDAIWIVPPVAMSVYFMFAYMFFVPFAFYYEKKAYITISTTISAVANIILNFIFIDMFGYYAAGYTTLACFIIYALCHYLFMKKVCKEHIGYDNVYNSKILIYITVGFMVFGFVFLFSYYSVIIRYAMILSLIVLSVIFRSKIVKIVNLIKSLRS